MEASQELAAGDVLMRFKAEGFQNEPRRGNNKNRHTRSTSAQCLEIVPVHWVFLCFDKTFIQDTVMAFVY